MSSTLLAVDRLHSPLARLGAKNSITAYMPYGHKHGLTAKPNLGFAGQLYEPGVGWYFLGNGYRAYNSRLMCFHSPDAYSPFGKGGINSYGYCNREPVNSSDPSGRNPVVTGYVLYKVGGELLNQGLVSYKKYKEGHRVDLSDPWTYVRATSKTLKFGGVILLGGAEVGKMVTPSVADPTDAAELLAHQQHLEGIDATKYASMALFAAGTGIDIVVNSRGAIKAYVKNKIEKLTRTQEENSKLRDENSVALGDEPVAIDDLS